VDDASTTYFHCAPIVLGVGSLVAPGNWGRILNLYDWNPNNFSLNIWREALLEQARQIHAPTKPSRLHAAFTLPTLNEAIDYRTKHSPMSVIHEVVPTSASPAVHHGDYELAIYKFSGRYFQRMFDFGKDYWTVPPQANHEVLFDCALRVVGQHVIP
jgi:hypothetical protein